MRFAAYLAVWLICSSPAFAATDFQIELMDRAATILEDSQSSPDRNIPAALMRSAKAIVVFPQLVKGGFIFGAHYGRGLVSVRDKNTGEWSQPSFLTTMGYSFGLQAGVEFADLVLLVMSYDGVDSLLRGQLTLGVDIAVAAGPIGRHIEADFDVLLQGQNYSYSRTQGVFAGVAVKAMGIAIDDDQNEVFYGKAYTPEQILTQREAKDIPESCRRFIHRINKTAPGPKF